MLGIDDLAAGPVQGVGAHTASVSAATSLYAPHLDFIETQLRLKRNATAIYQDLVDSHGFAGQYNSVKRFVARLRHKEPEQFDRLSFLPGEEMQVDYDEGPRDWKNTSFEQFIEVVDSYVCWYNEKRIKISLGSLSPIEYRESLGLAA